MFSVSRILLLHILFFLLFFFAVICYCFCHLLLFLLVMLLLVLWFTMNFTRDTKKNSKITHTQIHHRNKIIIILCTLICVLKWCNLHIAHTHKNLSFLIPDNPILFSHSIRMYQSIDRAQNLFDTDSTNVYCLRSDQKLKMGCCWLISSHNTPQLNVTNINKYEWMKKIYEG